MHVSLQFPKIGRPFCIPTRAERAPLSLGTSAAQHEESYRVFGPSTERPMSKKKRRKTDSIGVRHHPPW